MDFGWPIGKVGQKMVNGQLLFLALMDTHTHVHTHIHTDTHTHGHTSTSLLITDYMTFEKEGTKTDNDHGTATSKLIVTPAPACATGIVTSPLKLSLFLMHHTEKF